jgi:hypothetical protein
VQMQLFPFQFMGIEIFQLERSEHHEGCRIK